MKTTSVLAIAAATAAVVTSVNAQDAAFTNAEKALWIDRHNYFRMTALPFSAGNMLKIKWSDDLATAAAAEAADCAAVTGAGINVHVHSTAAAASTGSVVDMAFKEWAVTAGLSALATIKAPKAAGDGVGTGVYNSYSQIVWSTTNQVGCSFAACPAGKLVVCKYAAAGNGANEPWYIHAPPNSQCPGGTQGKLGLCVASGDVTANNELAPIPDGQHAYDVFASFIDAMHKALKGETVVDAGPATGTGASTNPAATATVMPTKAPTMTAPPTAEASTTTATPSPTMAPTTTGSAATASPSTTTTKAPTTAGAGSNAASTSAGSTDGADSTKSIGFGSLPTTGSAAAASSPGTVRAGSSTGTTFTNAASKAGAATKASSTATTAQSTTETTAAEPTKATKSTGGGSGTANNKGGDSSSSGGGFSAAGVAGAIVVGCVLVAGVFVFVSYRKNQRRQRDIMQNGGIMVL